VLLMPRRRAGNVRDEPVVRDRYYDR